MRYFGMRKPGVRGMCAVCFPLGLAGALAGCGRAEDPTFDVAVRGGRESGGGRGTQLVSGGSSSAFAGGASGGVSLVGGAGAGFGAGGQGGASFAPNGGAAGYGTSPMGGGSSLGSGGSSLGGGAAAAEAGTAGTAGANSCRDLCAEAGPACCIDELRCVTEAEACRFDVLVDTVGVTYEYSVLEQKFAAATGAVSFSLSDADLVSVATDPPPSARFELHLTDDASAAAAAFLPKAYGHLFKFSCDARTLFVGVVYPSEGAAALDTPVLHVMEGQGAELVLHLVAWQSAWWSPEIKREALAGRIDRPELRGAYCARGILSELK